MNICHFGFSMSLISGHSKPAFELAHYQQKMGLNVKILSSVLSDQYAERHKKLINNEKISSDTYRPFKSPYTFLHRFDETTSDLLEWADIIHVYGPNSLLLLKKYLHKNDHIVLTINSQYKLHLSDMCESGLTSFRNLKNPSYLASLMPNTFFSPTLSMAKATICWTNYLADQVRKLGIPNVYHIPVGINLDNVKYYKNNYNDDFIFLYMGYLASARGVDALLTAFKIVHSKWPKTQLMITHTELHPSEQNHYMKKINSTIFRESTQVMGFVNDLSAIINKANVVVLPFRTSVGYSQPPLTILESLAHGRPVITTNIGCTSEIIQNGYNGFISPPSDYISLAKSMLRMRTINLEEMSNNAREYVIQHHNWPSLCRSTTAVYDTVLSS